MSEASAVTEISAIKHAHGDEVRGRIPEDRAAAMDARLESYARAALDTLNAGQKRRDQVGAMHAAGFFTADGLVMLREDVGRHNALDKLIGPLAGTDASQGAVIATSRLSVDLVQKCVRAGIAAHLKDFREPRMSNQLKTYLGQGGEGLNALVIEAGQSL